jgi:hypothetical protein
MRTIAFFNNLEIGATRSLIIFTKSRGQFLIHFDEEYLVVTRIREHAFYIGNF